MIGWGAIFRMPRRAALSKGWTGDVGGSELGAGPAGGMQGNRTGRLMDRVGPPIGEGK